MDRLIVFPEALAHRLGESARRFFDNMSHPGTTEIAVAKAWCTPARDVILTALQPYGVVIHAVGETLLPNTETPRWIEAYVRVNANAAEWAEYLLLRSSKFRLISKPLNRKNREWARRHNGVMPTPWDTGEPWAESGCTKANGQPPSQTNSRRKPRQQQRRRHR